MDALHVDDPAELGSYQILARLGAGGMGVVYLGRDAGGRAAAVKAVYPHLIGDAGFRARFAREIATARTATGPWIARVVEADPDADRPWFATEFIDGPNLEQRVSASGPFPRQEVEDLAVKLAEALAALHTAGVVHRDLKPRNVLLAEDGPRLVDFGVAKALDAAEVADSGYAIGAPAFMSPEQATGGEAGPASDIFSLASVLTFAATGRSPFGKAGGPVAMLLRVSQQDPDLSDVADPLRSHLLACLSRVPARRPTAQELVEKLRRPTTSVRPPPEPSQPVEPVEPTIHPSEGDPLLTASTSRRRLLVAGLATAATIGIGGTVILTSQARSAPAPPAPMRAAIPTIPATSAPPPPPPTRKITLDGRQTLLGHRRAVQYGVFSPDGRTLATGSQEEDTAIRLWDTSTGQQIGSTLELEFSAAFSPDGAILATGGDRGMVTLREANTRRKMGQLDARMDDHIWVHSIAFSPDGRTVAIRTGSVVSLWDLATRTLLRNLPDESRQFGVLRVQFTPDGRFLLLSGAAKKPQWVDVATGSSVWSPAELGPAALSADGRVLAVWDELEAQKLAVYDTSTRAAVLEMPSHSNAVLNPDGTVLARGGGSIWDVLTGQEIADLNMKGGPLAFSPDGSIIAYAFAWQVILLHVTVSAT
jgi:serine/threonine protein kinase